MFACNPRDAAALTGLRKCLAAMIPILALTACDVASAGQAIHYRLVKAKTVQLKDKAAADAYAQSLKQLGCEQRLDGHDGHFHLTIRCPEWRQAEFANHDMAHKWQDWLRSLGFET